MSFKVVIPARYASQRLPGKPLLEIAGRPMLQHVYERASKSGAEQVVIATDDERIAACADVFGGTVCMTSADHQSGSDRIAETATLLNWPDDSIIVNLQGDEPLMPAANIQQVAENLRAQPNAAIATLCTPIHNQKEVQDPNVVKVVFDSRGHALYFSRASIPYIRNPSDTPDADIPAYRHIGLYAYRAGYLRQYCDSPQASIETLEQLEQLRALWRGDVVHVAVANRVPGPGVDTREDYEWVCQLVNNMNTFRPGSTDS